MLSFVDVGGFRGGLAITWVLLQEISGRDGAFPGGFLELAIDLSDSSRTDRLVDTVSYSSVVTTATAAFKNANYKLLERAAGAVADAVLAAFARVSAIKVTVHKPHAPIAAIFDDVGVVLTRTRK